jgi:hypothetical protein
MKSQISPTKPRAPRHAIPPRNGKVTLYAKTICGIPLRPVAPRTHGPLCSPKPTCKKCLRGMLGHLW